MLKLIFLGLALVALGNAGERTANVTSGNVTVPHKIPGVNIVQIGDKTTFNWNMDVDSNVNTLEVNVAASFPETQKRVHIYFKDICAKNKEKSYRESAQKFILSVIANQEECPIKKGANSTLSLPFVVTYSSDNKICGPFKGIVRMFEKNAKKIHEAIMLGVFKGELTGCPKK